MDTRLAAAERAFAGRAFTGQDTVIDKLEEIRLRYMEGGKNQQKRAASLFHGKQILSEISLSKRQNFSFL